jgi:hypothetical protein
MERDHRRNRMRIAVAAMLAVLGLSAATAGAHGSSSQSREAKMLLKCQRQIASEGIQLTGRLSWKMARCVLPLGDCGVDNAGRPDACDRAARSCNGLPGEVAGLKGRFVSRVASACGGLGMDKLMGGLGFTEQMADCSVASSMDFARCLADNLHEAEAESIVRMAPAACTYIERAGLGAVFPPSMCLDGENCEEEEPPPTCEGDLYCGGPDAVACPSGMVCNRLDPSCGSTDVGGVCVAMPTGCTADMPVCGCDGQTYASDCHRVMAEVVLEHQGACETTSGCFSNGDCGAGQFCNLPAGDCGESQMGTCMPMDDPECSQCGEYSGAVCGCDGVTYSTDCARRAAGMSKFSNGSCAFF